MPFKEAEEHLREYATPLRAYIIDGEKARIGAVFNHQRINVEVNDGIIVRIIGYG